LFVCPGKKAESFRGIEKREEAVGDLKGAFGQEQDHFWAPEGQGQGAGYRNRGTRVMIGALLERKAKRKGPGEKTQNK